MERRARSGDEPPAGAAAFEFPARAGDRLLAAASRIERAARGLGRLVAGRPGAAGLGELGHALRAPRRGTPAPAPRGRPILYLPAVPWGYRFQRPQQLACALGAAGGPVVYVEAFARTRLLPSVELAAVAPNVWRLQLAVRGRPDPFREPPAPGVAEDLARRIAAGLRERPLLVLAQLPFWTAVAGALADALAVPLVYDCIDLHRGFSGVPPAVERLEQDLATRSDLVTATSGPLLGGVPGARRRALLPNAVDLDGFPERARSFGPPVSVGYVGALAGWFDAAEVERLAEARPGWRVRLAGRIEDARVGALARLPNVELLGEVPHREVPAFLGGLQALIVPFLDLPLTRAVDPVKLYEALACGLPVVSRRLPALGRWPEPLVYGADDGSLLAPLQRALDEDGPALARLRRRAVAGETWRARADALLGLVACLPENGSGPADAGADD